MKQSPLPKKSTAATNNLSPQKLQLLDRKELIDLVQNLQKRSGLCWEENTPEAIIAQTKVKPPTWEEIVARRIAHNCSPASPVNLLIEGDNYQALTLLQETHQEKVDLIYIDPPYNTGNMTWRYNNNYVNKNDTYKHSKWLSFMAHRLGLAKNLLKKDGLLVVTIDDYELFPLGMLLNQLFGEENRLATVTIIHHPNGRTDDKFFSTTHEYALVYAKERKFAQTYKFELTPVQKQAYKLQDATSAYKLSRFLRTNSHSTRQDRPNMFYPIYYNLSTGELKTEEQLSPEMMSSVTSPATSFPAAAVIFPATNWVKFLPLDAQGKERVWRWGKETFLSQKDSEIVVQRNKAGTYGLFCKDRLINGRKFSTVWNDPKYSAAIYGSKLLREMFGEKVFDYPKSLWAVFDVLRFAVLEKKEAVILDFFAGSGTTGQAVLELNQQDGGQRQFILCTNNENQICEKVTYERLKKVMTGYQDIQGKEHLGLGGNLVYYRCEK